ncbi:MAG: biopolymer transporter ExbD [Planctomycetes bacterium]|nr:biopolymer transporter ExbD [Planctomycetota bacterium]NUQ33830.1 biopolymer transporter ExbD [Planctomycetaceae bacterium]
MRRRRIFGKDREHAGAGVDMAPLIDMVFILLIFFAVTTSFLSNSGVEIERPASDRSKPFSDSAVSIAVTKQGDVFLDGQRINADDSFAIRTALERSGAKRVLLEGDREAQMGIVLKVYDACFAAGADDVSIAANKR